MVKRMLIDATHLEETRVVIANGTRLEEFDFESSTKKQLKGNIYLAKVTRVEPSLQAAFVDFGGNRHGFLPFSEIHPDYYQIPVADRQALIEEQSRMGGFGGDTDADFGFEDDHEAESAAGEHSDESTASPSAEDLSHEPLSGEPSSDDETHRETTPEGVTPEHAASEDGIPDWATGSDDLARDGLFRPTTSEDNAFSENQAWSSNGRDLETPTADAEPAERRLPFENETPAEIIASDPVDSEASPAELAESTAQAATEAANELIEGGDVPPGDNVAEIAEPVEAKTVEEISGGDEVEAEVEGAAAERRRGRPGRHRYKIQEVIKRRQILLVQVVKEERGNKGAALTTYLSLAGRYCVLMPNTARGGGISRKISNPADRKRLKAHLDELDIPEGMAVILRTAAVERSKAELKRDYEYLLRQWDDVRELTLKSIAPALVYEEANLIKRSIRDHYSKDVDEILVEGEEGYRNAKEFMRMLMPSHAKKVQQYRDPEIPLFHRYQIETQLDAMHNPVVNLKSGGYIVINPTEALVSIDVNSGRATRERNIEETAYKTNLEAAEEIARQLRLRDLAGLIVIDFIDMEESRNQHTVEKRLKEAMRVDRARIQIGKISAFGLLELSRQRLRPSFLEASTERCPHCAGTGVIRSTESAALHVIRAIEEEGIRRRASEVKLTVPSSVAIYLLNHKRNALATLESRYDCRIFVGTDDALIPPDFRLDRLKAQTNPPPPRPVEEAPRLEPEDDFVEEDEIAAIESEDSEEHREDEAASADEREDGERGGRRRRRRRRRRDDRGESRHDLAVSAQGESTEALAEDHLTGEMADADATVESGGEAAGEPGSGEDAGRKRRRRGKRGGRRRRRREDDGAQHQVAGSTEDGQYQGHGEQSEGEDGAQGWVPDHEGAHAGTNGDLPAEHVASSHSAAQEDTTPHTSSPQTSGYVSEIPSHAEASQHDAADTSSDAEAAPHVPAPETEDPSRPRRRGWWQRLTQ